MPYDFIREFILLPQSPMLHFQHDCIGAALRASEVKPKLDRYLLSKKRGKVPDAWRNPKNPDALNYRLHFEALEQNEPILVGKKGPDNKSHYDIYYGNMGIKDEDCIKGVKNKLKMTVTCFNKELMDFIDSNLDAFFIVTNFGRMQNKGFGSFILDRHPRAYAPENIAAVLKKEYGAAHCYQFVFKQYADEETLFRCIKTVYSIIKSGMNFNGRIAPSLLFSYLKENGFGNEKMWLIGKGIAPKAKNSNYPDKVTPPNNPHYLRALLGVGDHIDFLNDVENRSKWNKTTVSIANSDIQRLPSPVFFKIINGNVYYIGKPISPCIYGKKFSFKSPLGSDTLCVPTKESLPENFMDDFMHYCRDKLNNKNVLGKFRDTANLTIKEV